MRFSSILFEKNFDLQEFSCELDFYRDLNLDLVINTAISYKKEFDIKKFFYMLLDDMGSIRYRQDIMKDLQKDDFYLRVDEFAQKMLEVQRYGKIIENLDYKEYGNGWFLQIVLMYCRALQSFADVLIEADLNSNGFILFRKQ